FSFTWSDAGTAGSSSRSSESPDTTTGPDSTGSRPSSRGTGTRMGRVRADVPRTPGKAEHRLVELDENGIASSYLREAFEPGDRLAVVVISRRHGGMIQRIAPVERLAAEDCQRWLRYMNEIGGYEVYLTMNALKDSARGRTREDVGAVRHVYLDLDEGGEATLEKLLARSDLPKPNHVLTTSPGKYQVVW